jgi:hypothetical protein
MAPTSLGELLPTWIAKEVLMIIEVSPWQAHEVISIVVNNVCGQACWGGFDDGQNLSRLELQGKFWRWLRSLLDMLASWSWRLSKMLWASLLGRFWWWPRSLPVWVAREVLATTEVPFNMLMGWSQQLPRSLSSKDVGEVLAMAKITHGLNCRGVVNDGRHPSSMSLVGWS